MIITKLSKQLTEDIVSKENNILANISFTIRGLEDQQNFTALSWYAEIPSSQDQLYKILRDVSKNVDEWQQELKEHHSQFEDKRGCGISTQYLLVVPDEEWTNFTIDEVMALYLVDLADLSKTR